MTEIKIFNKKGIAMLHIISSTEKSLNIDSHYCHCYHYHYCDFPTFYSQLPVLKAIPHLAVDS